MLINIRTSEANQEIVRKITSKLPVGTKENVVARIALGYSLQNGKRFSNSEFNIYDSKGKEYKDHILFDAKYRYFYIALAHAILENSMPNNINCKKVKQVIEVAEMNKRNVKYIRRGKNIIPKIKRRDRFKLFKKINAWKN